MFPYLYLSSLIIASLLFTQERGADFLYVNRRPSPRLSLAFSLHFSSIQLGSQPTPWTATATQLERRSVLTT